MLALRYAGLLALTVWIGGLLVLGAVFGETLRRFHLLSYGCGGVLLLTMLTRAVLGPRPRRFAIRLAIAAVMLAASAYSGFVVSARIARTQALIGGAPSSLAENDPRRVQFGRLHATSTALLTIPVLGGLFLLFWELKD